ncbi:MAG TPA: GspE/PulE family protein [Candidatus Paceibacterota bacterium]
MQIPDQKLKEALIKEGLITEVDFDAITQESKRMGQNISDILISRGTISENYFSDLLAEYFGVPKAHLDEKSIDEQSLRLLPEDLSRQKRVIVFGQDSDGALKIAIEDPSDLETIEFLKRYLKADLKIFLASQTDLNQGLTLYSRGSTEEFKRVIEENIAASFRSRASGAEEAAVELPIVAIVDTLIGYGVSSRASDIHLEVLEDGVLVRYRIDGILHEFIRIAKEVHPSIVARIKLLAGLKLDEHSKPQDGRFRQQLGSEIVDLRVSIIPTYFGEKIEMRLLAATQKPVSLEEDGMLEDTAKIVRENIKKSYGMVLVCGPTGSGKTTTLYSVLNILNRPEVNISTIEDPIEYSVKYVNQIQVNAQAGITFASGLRSLLRQDPNIIMVGEIRDLETADIAVNAALTGHLVLSTIHTNDASTAVPRLLDMKIPAFLVSAVLNVIVAQRLVGRICLDCIESYKADQATTDIIEKQLKELGIEKNVKVPKLLYRGKGCKSCGHSGLKGRMGIFEALEFNDEIRQLIVSPTFDLDGLRVLARQQGMRTMFEDGLIKAERGMTSIDEVLRVIRE